MIYNTRGDLASYNHFLIGRSIFTHCQLSNLKQLRKGSSFMLTLDPNHICLEKLQSLSQCLLGHGSECQSTLICLGLVCYRDESEMLVEYCAI